MKIQKLCLTAVLLLAVNAFSAVNAAEGFVKKPVDRQISIGKNKVLTLQPGKVQIVLDNEAYKSTLFAAEELAEHLGKVLNCKIRIKRGTADPGMTPIYVGFGKNNAMLDSKKLTQDAFYIVIKDGAVRIAGIDSKKNDTRESLKGGIWSLMHERASLFGVYDFLERFADCRFYFPGELGTLTPQAAKIDLPETFIIDRPDWEGRRFNSVFNNGAWYEGADPRATKHPGRTMHYYRIRFSTRFPIPSLHGTARMRLAERFAKSNPEYFVMRANGLRGTEDRVWGSSICYSSGMREEIYQDYVAMLRGDVSNRPGLEKSLMWRAHREEWINRKVVDVMPADAFERCHCPKCKVAMTDKENFATDLVWGYAAEVGRRLKKDGFNDAFVTMSAYFPCQDVPNVELPDNVDVLVCLTGPWDKYNPKKLNKDNDLIKRWSEKVKHKVLITNYGYSARLASSVRGLPDPTPRAHIEYYKNLQPYIIGVNDFYDNTDRFMYHHLEDYMYGKYAWDNNVDTDKLFAEYYERMFGKAAPVMTKIMDRFEDIWLQKIGGRTIDTPIGPVTSIPSASEIWSNIYDENMIKTITADFDAAAKLVSGDELKRIKLFRQEFLDPLVASRNEWKKSSSLPQALIGFADSRIDCPLYLNPLQSNSKLQTVVKCQFVNNNLVVEYECEEPTPEKMITTVRKTGDQECWKDNGIEFVLNPSGDKTNYVHVFVSSSGQLNAVRFQRYGSHGSYDWNKQLKATAQVKVLKNKYTVKVTIPASELGEINKNGFPANFMRSRIVKGEPASYFVWGKLVRKFHDIENFGTIKTAQPMIRNGSFTLPFNNMRAWNAKTVTRDTGNYISAPASLFLDTTKGRSDTHQFIKGYKPNTRYRISFAMKTENIKPVRSGTSGACIKIQDKNGHQIWVPKPVIGTTGWIRYSQEFTSADKIYPNVGMSVWIYNGTGKAWFDDFVIEEIK